MYRFLLSPKWILGHILVVAVLVTFVAAGFWQLRRLDEVRTARQLGEERLTAAPVAFDALVDDVGTDATALVYRRVEVTGRYLTGQQVATIPRSRDGRPGNLLLTPLAPTGGGPTVLVERGWVPFDREGVPTEQAAPPAEEVTVDGVLLPSEGDGTREVFNDAGLVVAVDPAAIEDDLGLDLVPLPLRLLEQRPPQTSGLPVTGPVPEFDDGNHASYAVQWFTFAAVALIGYPLLVVRTARDRARPPQRPRPVNSAAT